MNDLNETLRSNVKPQIKILNNQDIVWLVRKKTSDSGVLIRPASSIPPAVPANHYVVCENSCVKTHNTVILWPGDKSLPSTIKQELVAVLAVTAAAAAMAPPYTIMTNISSNDY